MHRFIITTRHRTFNNRYEAGIELANKIKHKKYVDPVVFAIPRGGVVLGYEVARVIRAPLGVVFVQRISHPLYPEYAIGAIAEDQHPIYNDIEKKLIDKHWVAQAENKARRAMRKQKRAILGFAFEQPEITGKTVILVDDGVATGFSMESAIAYVRRFKPSRVVVATPIVSQESYITLRPIVDDLVVLENPENFMGSVSGHYKLFHDVNIEEVQQLLYEANYAYI